VTLRPPGHEMHARREGGVQCFLVSSRKQLPHLFPLIHHHMQVDARRQQTRMPRGSFHFSQSPATSQRVADERVPSVVM
jgi:hypothetical protein